MELMSEEFYDAGFKPDEYTERKLARMHPTPEESLFRLAVERALNNVQRKIWDYYNHDRLTEVEIAKRMKVSQSAISQRIKVIEQKLIKYCKEYKQVHNVLKEGEAYDSEDTGC